MTKDKKTTFYVEGPDWNTEVEIDTTIFEDEASQLFEAGTKSIEKRLIETTDVNIGAILLIKKGSEKTSKEALVNAYICLNNASQYKLAEMLRKNYKDSTGNDLSIDGQGYSY